MCFYQEYDTTGCFLRGESSALMPKDRHVHHAVLPGCFLLRIFYPKLWAVPFWAPVTASLCPPGFVGSCVWKQKDITCASTLPAPGSGLHALQSWLVSWSLVPSSRAGQGSRSDGSSSTGWAALQLVLPVCPAVPGFWREKFSSPSFYSSS